VACQPEHGRGSVEVPRTPHTTITPDLVDSYNRRWLQATALNRTGGTESHFPRTSALRTSIPRAAEARSGCLRLRQTLGANDALATGTPCPLGDCMFTYSRDKLPSGEGQRRTAAGRCNGVWHRPHLRPIRGVRG